MNQDGQNWTVDLTDILDCLDILFAVIDRHPGFLANNLAYDRNFMELLQSAADCMGGLGDGSRAFAIGPTPGRGMEYVESDAFGYDETKVDALRREIISKAELLGDLGMETIHGIETDLKQLKEAHPGKLKKTAIALIVLSPFLYQYQGRPVRDGLDMGMVIEAVSGEPVASLENLYLDFFTDYLSPIFTGSSNQKGYGQVHEAVQFVLNQFIEKQVKPATRLYSDGSRELSKRKICIREAPKPFGLFRGMVGKDCSMVSVPFYSLSQKARVYWIWKGDDVSDQPDGYVFMMECVLNGETIPYVVTINGPTLNQTDARAVLYLICQASRSEQCLVPPAVSLTALVNTSAIQNAMKAFPENPKEVGFPDDWKHFEEYSRSRAAFSNYYSTNFLNHGNHVQLDNDSFIVSQWELEPEPMYAKESKYDDFPLFDRAVIGEYALASPGMREHQTKIMKILRLEEDHIETIKEVRPARERMYVSPELFEKLSRVFDFKIQNLLDFKSVWLLANSMRGIFDYLKPPATDRAWASLVQKTDRAYGRSIQEELGRDNPSRDRLNNLVASKLSLPDVYLANYWEENSPYLVFEDGEVYHYRVHRYVKYFTSRAIIRRFLDFLETHESILSGVVPGEHGWQAFFENAFAEFPDDPRLSGFLDRVFLKTIREEVPVNSDYDYAAALVSYSLILGEGGPPFLYQTLKGLSIERVNETFRQLIAHVRPMARLESFLSCSEFSDYKLESAQWAELNGLKNEPGGTWIEKLQDNPGDESCST